MNYYEVYVAEDSYHGNEPLTYHSALALKPGAIVEVELRKTRTLAVVTSASHNKPHFKTKGILGALSTRPLPKKILQLIEWVQAYYPSSVGSATKLALPTSLSIKNTDEITTSAREPAPPALPSLSPDQQQALANVQTNGIHILHGQTGSGKTRVYIELAKQALRDNKSVIILTPEISLTPQLVDAFTTIFGSHVLVSHSMLSPKQRRQIWLQCLDAAENPIILVGPRSCLFYPLDKLGLIVIDEEHENAYKQEQSPHYHAVRVASKLTELHKCRLILGSATPSIVNYYMATRRNRPIITMSRLSNHESEKIIVDLKDKSQFTRHPYLSDALLKATAGSLKAGQQVLLFLNRRGTARITLCNNCGWQADCPNCDVPLTYHGDEHLLRCHICGVKNTTYTACPSCGNTTILFKSIGTKALESDIRKLFPDAIIGRYDTDNKKNERFEQKYTDIRDGKVHILIGTQLLVKGLDLPKLGLIGLIIADASLYLPDYTADERTYQLINQALGRVSRGHTQGKAIIQTYQPESPLLLAAARSDWREFYETEIAQRKAFNFPPFCHMLKLTCTRKTRASAEKAATALASTLANIDDIEIDGPGPAFHERVSGSYRWQIIIKAKQRSILINIIKQLPSNWSYDIDPTNIL